MVRFLAVAAMILGMVAPVGAAFAEGAGQITVTGTGTVAAAPDMASISLGVTTQGQTAAEALTANNAAMADVMARLSSAGIAPRDLQTSNLQLQPNWVQPEGAQAAQINGYTASNMVTARVRDLAILGGVLDAAVKDGANTLNGIAFEQSDPAPAQSAARKLAVEDARARASEMLQAAGVGLGKIVSMQESGGYVSPMPMVKAMMDEAAVPVAAGELGVSAQVTVVFEIVQ